MLVPRPAAAAPAASSARTVVLELAPAAMGVPAASVPPLSQPETFAAPPTPPPAPPTPPQSQLGGFAVPEAQTQTPVGIDDQSDAQLEQVGSLILEKNISCYSPVRCECSSLD